MRSAGVRVSYASTAEAPTGCCCVLVTGAARTLVASPGAAATPGLLLPHLQLAATEELVGRARCCYMTSYVLRSQPDAVMHLARRAAEVGGQFCGGQLETFGSLKSLLRRGIE